uniref:Uncharacterized protein n=1 Tax=Anopheles melas TaxID=34690 RepID=A0A182TIQ9_9DIPT
MLYGSSGSIFRVFPFSANLTPFCLRWLPVGRRSPIPLPVMSCLLELVESSTSSSSEFSPEADELLRWRTGLVLPWHLATNRSSAISSSRNGTWVTRRARVIEIWQKANV